MNADDLRRRAEVLACGKSRDLNGMTLAQVQKLLHELDIHQIELEMQNEELRQAQMELEDSQSRYFDLYELAPVGYLTLDEPGLILQANLTAATLLGVSRRALINRPLSLFILPGDQDLYYRFRKQNSVAGLPNTVELRLIRHNAKPVWVRLQENSFKEFEGDTVSRLVVSDISQSKAMEQALRESEELYSAIVNQAADGIALVDLETFRFVESNESFRDNLGYSGGELVRLTIPDVEAGVTLEQIHVRANEVARTGGIRFECQLRRKDGGLRDAAISVCTVNRYGRQCLAALVRDVTEEKRAQKALRDATHFLRQSQSIAKVGGWKVNPAANTVEWTEEVYHLVERPLEQSHFDLEEGLRYYAPECLPALRKNLSDAWENGTTFCMETEVVTDSGRRFWAELRGIGRVEEDGEVYITGTFQDISERKRAEELVRASWQFVKSSLDGLTAHVCVIDEKGVIVLVNRAWRVFAEANGTDPGMVCEGVNYFAACDPVAQPPDDLRDATAAATGMRDILAGRRDDFEMEYFCSTPKGDYWFIMRVSPMKVGNLEYLVVAHQDITARKQTEEAQRQSHDLLAKLSRQVPGIIYQFKMSPDGHYCLPYVSDEIHRLFGLSPEQVSEDAEAIYAVVHPDDLDGFVASINESAKNLLPWRYEFRVVKPGQPVGWCLAHSRPEALADGSILWHGFATDMTERKVIQSRIEQQAAFTQAVIDVEVDGLAVCHVIAQPPFVNFTVWNPAMERLSGYFLEEINRLGWYQTVYSDPEVQQQAKSRMERMLQGEHLLGEEWTITRKDGIRRVVQIHTAIVANDSSGAHVLAVMRDVTERKRLETRLQLAANVFTYAREGIIITDATGAIVDVNDTFSRIVGYSREEVLGKNPRIFKSGWHEPEFYAALWHDLTTKGHWYGEMWNRCKNGDVFAELITISAVRDDSGQIQNYVALFSDITAIKEHQHQLEHIAHYDVLTGLPNRLLLTDRLEQAMAQADRRGSSLAVAFLDLDGFKAVNDRHGHGVGDALLVAVAQRLKAVLREVDTLARIGGDEFVAILVDLEQPQDYEPLVKRLLQVAAEPVMACQTVLHISASIGVTIYPLDESNANQGQLLRHADQSMYTAKQMGKNRYHVFDVDQDMVVKSQRESLQGIRRALDCQEFVLHYQPKVNMKTGSVIGAEALVRWQHPERGLLLPADFLPILADHAFGIELGEWVIDAALAQLVEWQSLGLDIPVSVNIGPNHLLSDNFVLRLRDWFAAHPGIPPALLEMEVLESDALEDIGKASRIMLACREIGLHFALDDFGTGYSSLTYLKRLPVDMLKIDQSFVADMMDDSEDLAIVEGVIGLAKAFRLQVIAEGVETVRQGELLLALGCELAQGHIITSPMQGKELPGWMDSWHPDESWTTWRDRTLNSDDIALILVGVKHRQWLRTVRAFLSGDGNIPPPMDVHACGFGLWLDAGGLARYSADPTFSAVSVLHDHAHVLAEKLFDLHVRGQQAEIQVRLGELQAVSNELMEKLRGLVHGRK